MGDVVREIRHIMGMVLAAMVLATVLACLPVFADGDYTAPPVTPPPEGVGQPPMTADQLDELLSPIALYPDPLLAQILPAAAEPDDIAAAAAWIAAGNDPNQIDDQPWDPSVQAIARYPSVLQMLAGYPDWTAEVGNAFATQQADVAASIQRLRAQAASVGSLVNTQQQTVVSDDDGIQIVPTDPQYVYVPVYDPQVVYVAPPPGIVANARITFGPPLATGIWLDNGWSWRGGYIVVGGGWRYWRGGVWVPIYNRPGGWPPYRYGYRPGWDGRPHPWRPRPGRPPYRPPMRPPIIPGRPNPNRPWPGGGGPGAPAGESAAGQSPSGNLSAASAAG